MKTRTNQSVYNDNGELSPNMPNVTASDSGKVLGIDESGNIVPVEVSGGSGLHGYDLTIKSVNPNTLKFTIKCTYITDKGYTTTGSNLISDIMSDLGEKYSTNLYYFTSAIQSNDNKIYCVDGIGVGTNNLVASIKGVILTTDGSTISTTSNTTTISSNLSIASAIKIF